jgi:hypothetical protein
MEVVDRVMTAHAKAHKLTDEQVALVRREISNFTDQFLQEYTTMSSQKELGRQTRLPGKPSN